MSVLAPDIGTTGVTALVVSEQGQVLRRRDEQFTRGGLRLTECPTDLSARVAGRGWTAAPGACRDAVTSARCAGGDRGRPAARPGR